MNIQAKKAMGILGLLFGLNVSLVEKSEAGKSRFNCQAENGVWTTVVNSTEGKVPLIRWTSGDFAESGWTNKARCQAVSERFRRYDASNQLKLIKTGTVNRYPVLCATRTARSKCDQSNVLVTLKPGTNAKDTLEVMLDIRRRVSSGQAINLNDQIIIYDGDDMAVDLDKFIELSVSNSEKPTSDPVNANPKEPLF